MSRREEARKYSVSSRLFSDHFARMRLFQIVSPCSISIPADDDKAVISLIKFQNGHFSNSQRQNTPDDRQQFSKLKPVLIHVREQLRQTLGEQL